MASQIAMYDENPEDPEVLLDLNILDQEAKQKFMQYLEAFSNSHDPKRKEILQSQLENLLSGFVHETNAQNPKMITLSKPSADTEMNDDDKQSVKLIDDEKQLTDEEDGQDDQS